MKCTTRNSMYLRQLAHSPCHPRRQCGHSKHAPRASCSHSSLPEQSGLRPAMSVGTQVLTSLLIRFAAAPQPLHWQSLGAFQRHIGKLIDLCRRVQPRQNGGESMLYPGCICAPFRSSWLHHTKEEGAMWKRRGGAKREAWRARRVPWR